MRCLLVAALVLAISHPSAAQSAREATPEGHGTWSEEHTVKARPAQPEPRAQRSSWTDDRLALLAHVGIGAPAGALGLDVDVAPLRALAIDLGAGLSPSGWQFAATPRLRVRLAPSSFFTLGSGVSFGPYSNGGALAGLACALFCIMDGIGDSSGSIASQRYHRALWYNLELGVDVYAHSGRGLVRMVLGYGQILNDSAYSCTEDPKEYYSAGHGCDRTGGHGLLFASIAGGFDL